MATGNRPWEGTALAVIDIIGVVGAFIMAIFFLFLQGIFSGLGDMAASQGEAGAMGVMHLMERFGLLGGIIFIALGVLAIFMAKGAFKGQKWSPVVSLVFAGLAILNGLSGFGQMSSTFAVGLLLNIFTIYCGVMCLKNSYYR